MHISILKRERCFPSKKYLSSASTPLSTKRTAQSVALAGVVLFCMALIVGCSASPATRLSSSPASSETADYAIADSVRFHGVTYYRGSYGQDEAVPVEMVELSSAVEKVERRQAASGRLENGEATRLNSGTPLYAVKGYDTSFRLAAQAGGAGGAWALYEVFKNSGAKSAAELLDVRGKVEYVGLRDTLTVSGTEEVVTIRKPSRVAAIVDAALGAPLRQISGVSSRYLVVFHLEDGTESVRWYEQRSGELYLSGSGPYSGVTLPKELRESIRQALRS